MSGETLMGRGGGRWRAEAGIWDQMELDFELSSILYELCNLKQVLPDVN